MTARDDNAIRLELLAVRHTPRLEEFERVNRAFFADRIGDRGDDYFAHFADRLAALVDENEKARSLFCVLVTTTGQIVGRVNISDIDQPDLTELGFRVDADRQGQGVATHGVRAALDVARERDVSTIGARAAVDNVGSRRVLERCGFTALGSAEAPSGSDKTFVGYRIQLG